MRETKGASNVHQVQITHTGSMNRNDYTSLTAMQQNGYKPSAGESRNYKAQSY